MGGERPAATRFSRSPSDFVADWTTFKGGGWPCHLRANNFRATRVCASDGSCPIYGSTDEPLEPVHSEAVVATSRQLERFHRGGGFTPQKGCADFEIHKKILGFSGFFGFFRIFLVYEDFMNKKGFKH